MHVREYRPLSRLRKGSQRVLKYGADTRIKVVRGEYGLEPRRDFLGQLRLVRSSCKRRLEAGEGFP